MSEPDPQKVIQAVDELISLTDPTVPQMDAETRMKWFAARECALKLKRHAEIILSTGQTGLRADTHATN